MYNHKVLPLFISFILSISFLGCVGSSNTNSSPSSTAANVWLLGEEPPINSIGLDADLYLNTKSSDFYSKKAGVWKFSGSLKGQTGVKGDKGDKGDIWYTGGSDPESSALLGKENDFFLNTLTSDVFQKQNNLWIKISSFKGVKGDKGDPGDAGKSGAIWLTGTIAPPAGLIANNGDFYLNTITGQLYKKDTGVWVDTLLIVKGTNGTNGTNGTDGSNGSDGINGATWLTGTGAPAGGAGTYGDFYFNSTTAEVYQKTLTGWNAPIAALKGAKGDTGLAGRDGLNGTAWCSDSTTIDPNGQVVAGCNNDGSGNVGDFFLNSARGEIWKKTNNTTWSKVLSLAVESAIETFVTNLVNSKMDYLLDLISKATPPGIVVAFGGTICPSGYLKSDGTSYAINDYLNLANALYDTSTGKYAWGSVDSSHFNVPDLRGEILRGVDSTLNPANLDVDRFSRTGKPGGNTGNNVGSYQSDMFALHHHNYTTNSAPALNFSIGSHPPRTDDVGGVNTTTGDAGGSETRPKNAYVNYCIKY